jgi:hypothetical protein
MPEEESGNSFPKINLDTRTSILRPAMWEGAAVMWDAVGFAAFCLSLGWG